jgi:hypothetical protein
MTPPARTARHEALGGIKFTLSQQHFAYVIMVYEAFTMC